MAGTIIGAIIFIIAEAVLMFEWGYNRGIVDGFESKQKLDNMEELENADSEISGHPKGARAPGPASNSDSSL